MAKCEMCGKEMLNHVSCSSNLIVANNKIYPRIKVGDQQDLLPINPGERCHDCGAPYGGYHHMNCDSERCPICGEQLLGCNCEDIYYMTARVPFVRVE